MSPGLPLAVGLRVESTVDGCRQPGDYGTVETVMPRAVPGPRKGRPVATVVWDDGHDDDVWADTGEPVSLSCGVGAVPLDPTDIRDLKAWRYTVARNQAVDRWRHARALGRLRQARRLHLSALLDWREAVAHIELARDRACALLDRCPRAGAAEYQAYLRTGAYPLSDSPGRATWDKRIQRCRAWLFERLALDDRLRLGRGRGTMPSRPRLGHFYRLVILAERAETEPSALVDSSEGA